MSRINSKSGQGSALATAVGALRSTIDSQGTDLSSRQITQQVISMESLDAASLGELTRTADMLKGEIKNALSVSMESDDEGEELTDAQLEAGAIAAMAAGAPAEYADIALRSAPAEGGERLEVATSGAAGSVDVRETPSLEAFDERELAKFIPYSIAFNVKASRQDSFSEMFYPTTVVSPDQGGYEVHLRRTLVHNAIQHQSSGNRSDWQRKNLVHAAIDATILADESTALIPTVLANGSNADKFVPEALVAPTTRRIGNVDVVTAPLLIGQQVDLLGLSSHPGLLGAGFIDHTDAIDAAISLEKLYVQLDEGDAANSVAPTIVRFNTLRLARAGFVKSVEGDGREMALAFRTQDLVLDKNTTDVAGVAPAVLQAVRDANYTVRLSVNVTGTVNVQLGNAELFASKVNVASIVDEDGNEISLASGAGRTIAQALTATSQVLGYDLKAARTNSNRRTRGLLLDHNDQVFRYTIPLGAPISAPSPAGSNRDARDLESLIDAVRVRNTNNAVTRLLNYISTLKEYVGGVQRKGCLPSVEGVGGFLVNPFFEDIEIDMDKEISSIRDIDRAADVNALLVNAIRDVSYRMYRASGFQPALNASSNGSNQPKLLIGTDVLLQRHLMVTGDSRTFGIAFASYQIESTFDSRMDDTIVIALTRDGQCEAGDPLQWGVHAWIPELASSMMVARDGGTYPEAMVQPRNLHVNNVPVAARIKVKNLDKVLKNRQTVVAVAP